MLKLIIGTILLFYCQLGYSQTLDANHNKNEVLVTYDAYTQCKWGTAFQTLENGFVTKIGMHISGREGGNHLVQLWESVGNNNALLAGPYIWNILSGAQGWYEFEFPSPIAVNANKIYILSLVNSTDLNSANRELFNSVTSNALLKNPQDQNTENLGSTPQIDWHINNSVRIIVNPKLTAGTIGADQKICFNKAPSALTQLTSSAGGTGTYSYQWQSSPDNSTWTDISGATIEDFSPPTLTTNTWYRRNVSSGPFGTVSCDPILITITAILTPGTIGADQTICYNIAPAELTQLTAPEGGPDTYSYQWQSSTDNNNWTNISGANLVNYSPPALTTNTWYRRVVTSGNCDLVSSNSLLITVNANLTAGTIGADQTICYNTAPAVLTQRTAPAGGTGTYSYQWQSSTDNSTWTDLSGANLVNYSPPALTISTLYRRKITSGNCSFVFSNTVRITVTANLAPGTIGADQTICYNTAPIGLTQLTAPLGGTGTYSYQWQNSTDNTNWTDISGANLVDFSPPVLTSSIWYRRRLTSGTCSTVISNPVRITVNANLTAGTIGAVQTICFNTPPAALTQLTAPAGGTGTYSYQWQSSTDNSTWTNINGANLVDFSPPVLTSSIWYRRRLTSGTCGTVISNLVLITVNANLTPGTIGADQTICYDTGPAALTQLTAPSGGTGTYSYQWQSSPDNTSWTDISSANLISFSPPALTTSTWYRRRVTSGTCGNLISNTVHITVTVNLTPGTVGADQTICYNTAPAALTQLTAPTGGTGSFSYQWQNSPDNSTWTNINGANLVNFSPPALTTSTGFRRNITSGICTVSSSAVRISVNANLTAGTIGADQTICNNTAPSALTQLTAPSGGTGTYSYQWQSSPDNSTWTDISGANLVSFSPPVLTTSTWYRRRVISGTCGNIISNPVRITVTAILTPGTIGADQTICYNTAPAALTQLTPPSGGTGTYSYQWQRSPDNSTWTNISGANLANFSPPVLTANTWYRRRVTSGNCDIISSNSLLITVTSNLTAGTIGANQTICYNTTPAALTQLTGPNGGTGSFSYQWQRSPDNSTWTNINGANLVNFSPPALTTSAWYRRNVTSGICTAGSNSIQITVNSQVSLAQLHDNITIYNNTSTNFNVTISGGTSPYSINYTRNGITQTPIGNYLSGNSISTGVLTTGVYTYSLTSVSDVNSCNAQNLGNNITITVIENQGTFGKSNKALIIVNSTSQYYSDYVNYIRPYLENFGIPYDVCNINTTGLPDFNEYAVIVFGHKNVYSSGYPITQLEASISDGVGLYSFDPHLFDFASGFNTLISQRTVNSNQINILNSTHYITKYHATDSYSPTNNIVNLLSYWTVVQNSNLVGSVNMATMSSSGQTVSLLQVSNYGNGRVVKWCGYDWVFENILGPVYGMDDLLWRGIVWAARKPFAMQGLPPMITMRVDDVIGAGPGVTNYFEWINICNEFGIIPWCGTFNNYIPQSYIPILKSLIDNNHATASPHAFNWNDFIYFNHDNITTPPFDPAARARTARDFYIQNGLKISKYFVPHYYEVSSAALPVIYAMGGEFIGIHMLPDNLYYTSPWLNCGPYRINRYGIDYDAIPVYYGGYVNLNGINFFNCVTEIRDDGGYEWYPDNDVTTTTARGIRHLRRALNSMVLPSLFTHEYYFDDISPTNWREIIRQITSAIYEYNPQYTSTDYAVQYIRARNNIRITNVKENQVNIEISYSGNNDLDTKCYLFTEENGQITYQFVGLPHANGNNKVIVLK